MNADPADAPGSSPSPAATTTILVLDDDAMLVELIRIYLEGAGFAVLAAHDLDSAIDLASRHAVDLVLSDVQLPGVSPHKIAALFAALGPPQRILYMSGRSWATLPSPHLLAPGADLVEKPFTESGLVKKVRAALAAAAGVGAAPLSPLPSSPGGA